MLNCQACQTPNPEHHKFCQKCRTPLLRRYLLAIGDGTSSCQPGDRLADRYLCLSLSPTSESDSGSESRQSSRIFLDTKPGEEAINLAEVPAEFAPYLRLSPYQLHIPQIYDWLETDSGNPIVLLDGAPLQPSIAESSFAHPTLVPSLTAVWQTASALRQLNWLWQIAQLWQPLGTERAITTLLQPDLLRVEGPLLRLLELQSGAAIDLPSLGQHWQSLIPTAQPETATILESLCQSLLSESIFNSEQLINGLDLAIAQIAANQPRYISIATRTDPGPSRANNEDACYPPNGTFQSVSDGTTLVIVCDGIGGHEGGEVASHLAINSLTQQINALDLDRLDPIALTIELEKAVCIANDEISQRNDDEQRLDRKRMGTTVVMGLIRHHELYLTHVGDSRAYWITQQGCHQITVDDDVASRQVRLGYNTHRQALQQPSSGSLVQALGMGDSSLLYPTVQRFILDEDSIFLICSDGLSDNDRIEEYWDTEILPALYASQDNQSEKNQSETGRSIDLSRLSHRLIQLANTTNGHDNATIGLIHCQTSSPQPPASHPKTSAQLRSLNAQTPTPNIDRLTRSSCVSTLKRQVLVSQSPKRSILPLVTATALLLGLGGTVAYYWFTNQSISELPQAQPSPSPIAPPLRSPLTSLQQGTFVEIVQLPTQVSPQSNLNTSMSEPIGSSPIATLSPANTPLQNQRPDHHSLTLWSQPPVSSSTSTSLNSPASSPALSSPFAQTPNTLPPSNLNPSDLNPSDLNSSDLNSSEITQTEALFPLGSILKILQKQSIDQTNQWVEIEVCSIPLKEKSQDLNSLNPLDDFSPSPNSSESSTPLTTSSPTTRTTPTSPSLDRLTATQSPLPTPLVPIESGQTGWLLATDLAPIVNLRSLSSLTSDQQGNCTLP